MGDYCSIAAARVAYQIQSGAIGIQNFQELLRFHEEHLRQHEFAQYQKYMSSQQVLDEVRESDKAAEDLDDP